MLRRLLSARQRQPGALITGVVSARTDGWSVSWAGDGATPAALRAPSLSEAADQATAAVAALYAGSPPNPGAELQFAIYPWDYRDGPIFDISGSRGGFAAKDLRSSLPAVSGATLEDLVAAVEDMPGAGTSHCMFRWVQQISALPVHGPRAHGQ